MLCRHGQTDTVEGDGALSDDLRGQGGRQADPESSTGLKHLTGSIHMPLDQVAAEALAPAERTLQVDLLAGLAEAERGELPGLGDDVETQQAAFAWRGKGRQAASVHGQGVPAPDTPRETAAPEGEPPHGAGGREGDDAALTFDQTGEHGEGVYLSSPS